MANSIATQSKNNAAMYDTSTMIQAGIDPRTKLPIRMESGNGFSYKSEIRKQLRIMDEQNAVNRYTWTGLPKGLTSQLIERILYYRGQGMFFRLQDKFYFLPYALSAPEGSTGIDVYGRFTGVTPLPFNGTSNDGKKDSPWIRGLIFEPLYEAPDLIDLLSASPEELTHLIEKSCVLLHDYTPQISQTNIARQILQEPVLDMMSNCMPYMMTALSNSTGVMGMRVNNASEQANVDAASNAINKAALEGRKYVGVVGNVDFQELTGDKVQSAQEFLLAMQGLDNYRLSLYGLDNGGLFQKNSHMLEAEHEMNAGNTGLVAEDGLRNRQYAAVVCNTVWGTSIWCEPSECTLGVDRDGDMVAGNDGEASTARKQAQSQVNEGGENNV